MSDLLELAAVVDERLREFAGGYVNTKDGVVKERGAGAHFNRHAGAYIGGTLVFPVGAIPGHLIDRNRRKNNVDDTKREPKQEWRRKKDAAVEFAVKPRSTTKLMRTSKQNPLKIAKDGFGEFKVHPKGMPNARSTYFTPDIDDARNTAAYLLKRKRAGKNVGFESADGERVEFEAIDLASRIEGRLVEFSSDRDRDDAGRFSPGSAAPKPEDYAQAHGAGPMTININNGKEKRKGRLRTGVALGVAGTLGYQNRGKIAGMMKR